MGLAGARRCAALVRLAGAYDERAAEELRVAAAAYGALGLPFDARPVAARASAGRSGGRRSGARHGSRSSRSAAAFDRLGSPGWADDARSELQRVGAPTRLAGRRADARRAARRRARRRTGSRTRRSRRRSS